MNFVRKYADDFVENWTLFEKVWLVVFTAVNLYVYFALGQSLLGLIASLTGMLTVVLVAKGRISNYAFGVINVVIYGWLALQSQYFGEVMLNWAFYLPAQFIGYYLWSQNMKASGLVEAEGLSNKERVLWTIVVLVGIVGYGAFLKYLNGNLPFFDAASTVLSVMAQILMIRRATEQWILWILVDIISIYLWVTTYLKTGTGLSLVVMWASYLINACYGWYNWRKMEV